MPLVETLGVPTAYCQECFQCILEPNQKRNWRAWMMVAAMDASRPPSASLVGDENLSYMIASACTTFKMFLKSPGHRGR